MAKANLFFLPSWGPGHFIPLVEAGKRLLDITESFSITVLVMRPPPPKSFSAVQSYINEVSASKYCADLRFQYLPPVEPPAEFQGPEDFISLYIQLHAPHVKAAIANSADALVIDFFATTILDVADQLGVPAYVYFTSNFAMLALMLCLPALHEKIPVEFEDMEGEIEIPGISPIPPMSLPTPFMNRKIRSYNWFLYHGKRFLEAEGIIVNTALELEPRLFEAITNNRCVQNHPTPPVYPIGPVIKLKEDVVEKQHDCINWLDAQPPSSVVFLCFGSMGCFRAVQTKEIAIGLERSGHRFLWALRVPSKDINDRNPMDADLETALPEGFLERTKKRGLVWPSWAPQTEILSHKAVGGFVTHCGWNSSMESLWFGVPMIPWPLYAEQHLNAFEMVREMGVAVELKVDRKGGEFVEAEELERAVRCSMEDSEEGKKVREKAKQMRTACRNAVDSGGSSYGYLQKLAMEIGKTPGIVD